MSDFPETTTGGDHPILRPVDELTGGEADTTSFEATSSQPQGHEGKESPTTSSSTGCSAPKRLRMFPFGLMCNFDDSSSSDEDECQSAAGTARKNAKKKQTKPPNPANQKRSGLIYSMNQLIYGNLDNSIYNSVELLSCVYPHYLAKMEQTQTLDSLQHHVTTLEWHPKKQYLLVAGDAIGNIEIFRGKHDKNSKLNFTHTGSVDCDDTEMCYIVSLKHVCFDDSVMVAANGKDIGRYQLEASGSHPVSIYRTRNSRRNYTTAMDVCEAENQMIVGHSTGYVSVFDLRDGPRSKYRVYVSDEAISHLEFNPVASELFVTASGLPDPVKIWDLRYFQQKGNPLANLPHDLTGTRVNTARFSHNGQKLLTTEDGRFAGSDDDFFGFDEYDFLEEQNIDEDSDHEDHYNGCPAFIKKSRGQIRVFQGPMWREVYHARDSIYEENEVNATWYPLGETIVNASGPLMPLCPMVLDLADLNCGGLMGRMYIPESKPLKIIEFNPNGDVMAGGRKNGEILFWTTHLGKPKKTKDKMEIDVEDKEKTIIPNFSHSAVQID